MHLPHWRDASIAGSLMDFIGIGYKAKMALWG
jgi:hypothetical protein